MPDDIRIEASIPTNLDEALDRLASSRGQSKSALVRDALTEYVLGEEAALSEEAFIAAVEEGLADLDAGNTVPHAQVMREIEELLARKRCLKFAGLGVRCEIMAILSIGLKNAARPLRFE